MFFHDGNEAASGTSRRAGGRGGGGAASGPRSRATVARMGRGGTVNSRSGASPHSTKEIFASTIRGTRKNFFWCTLAARVLRLRGQGSFPFEVAVGLFTDEGIVLAGSYHFELGRWLQ